MRTALPLPSASVDAVVCDLPFGRKFSTRTNMAENLPVILSEMERFVFFVSKTFLVNRKKKKVFLLFLFYIL